MLTDMHTHTNSGPDAVNSPEEMCARAAELGLHAYAVTDHCDCNFWLPADEQQAIADSGSMIDNSKFYGARNYSQESIARIAELKERYPSLLCGIELGQPLQNREAAEIITSKPELDFIIGSHHQNAGMDDFYWIEYKKMDISGIYKLLEDALLQTLEMCRWGGFDVLGHLTYPLRYIIGEHGIDVDMSRFDDIIREIFRTLRDSGKGIEINTSGLRQKYGKTLPDERYVRLWRECGGEVLTIGSDAHNVNDLGAGIIDGEELARACGFKYIAYFVRRRPEFIKL